MWIDFFRKIDSEIGGRLSGHLEDGEVVAISAIFGELLQGAKNEAEEKVILEFWQSLPKIDEEDLFIEAGKLSRDSNSLPKVLV